MRIGLITNTDTFIPVAYTLISQQQQVNIYFSPSANVFTNQKAVAFAQQFSIPVTEEKNTTDLYSWLQSGSFDACFMLGYPHLIDINRIKTCKIYNIHFGPLPSFRGPSPVFWQLKQGVAKIELAIHEVSAKFDAGPVVWLKATDNLPHYNYEVANQVLGQLCVEGVLYLLNLIQHKMPVPVISRADIKSAYYKRPQLPDVTINWQQMGAVQIGNLIRAGNPWNKGAITYFNGQELKLVDAGITGQLNSPDADIKPGSIVNDEGLLHIYCSDGNAINVNMLFYADCFVPAYQAKIWGFVKGQQLG